MSNNQTLGTVATSAAPAEEKTYANFRDFNTFTAEARVFHTEIKAGKYGEFVTVTAVTTLKDGEQGVAVKFISSNGALKLAKAGHLMNGRRIHITGSVSAIESHYVNADGLVVPLQRPRLTVGDARVTLGAKPRSAMQADA